jgi:hypothetical protein
VREKIQMQMVEEGWKRKWDNYRFTSRWELHVYCPWAKLSPYLWRLIHQCDWRSSRNRHGFFSGVSPNEFPCWLPPDVLQMTQWLCLISDDTSERGLISSWILPIIMILVVVNDQKESWLVTPWVEALLWMKTIDGVHVLTGRGAVVTHMTYLTSQSISLQLYGEDSCKKHHSGRITTLVPIKQEMVREWQVIQKCPFLDPLWQLMEESLLLCQSHVLFNSNKI